MMASRKSKMMRILHSKLGNALVAVLGGEDADDSPVSGEQYENRPEL
jgi:hypothetical protein